MSGRCLLSKGQCALWVSLLHLGKVSIPFAPMGRCQSFVACARLRIWSNECACSEAALDHVQLRWSMHVRRENASEATHAFEVCCEVPQRRMSPPWGVVFQRRHTSLEVKRMVCAQWHQVSLVQPLSAFMRTALAFGAFGIYLKDDIRLEEKHFSLVRSVPPCGRTLRTRSFWVERCTAKAVGVQILLDSGICLRGWTSSLRRLDVIVLEETSFSETSGRFWAARKAPSFWP